MAKEEIKRALIAAVNKVKKVVPCEVYSRIVGYHRPVQSWNKGKCEEFKQRKVYDLQVSLVSCKVKSVAPAVPALTNY